MSALAFVALALIVSRQYVFPLDYTIQDWVQGGRRPALEALMRALTLLGSGWVLLPLAAIGYVLLRRAGHPLGRYVPVAVVGAFLLDGLSKWLVPRPRPRRTGRGVPSGPTPRAAILFCGPVARPSTTPVPPAW